MARLIRSVLTHSILLFSTGRRDGGASTNYLLLEIGDRITLEDGTGFLLLED